MPELLVTPALDHLTRQVKAPRRNLEETVDDFKIFRVELSIKNKALEDVLDPGPEAHTPLGPEPYTPTAGQGDVWMQNCASLVAAYLNEDWEGCRTLCDAYSRDSTFLRSVASMQIGQ